MCFSVWRERVDWEEERADGKQRGEVAGYTYDLESRDYGCDYLASAAVPYLSTQYEYAYCSACSWKTQVGVSM